MYNAVKLLAVDGERKVPMLANARTKVLFRQVFHADLDQELEKLRLMVGRIAEDPVAATECGADLDLSGKLAYIMSAAAEKAAGKLASFESLSIDGYMDWLEQFEAIAFTLASQEIGKVYFANQKTTSTGKKQCAPASGK